MTAGPTPAQFRQRFPALRETVHLASCSHGALSDALAGALAEFQSSILEHGAPWGTWMGRVEQARAAFAALIGAEPDEVAIVSSASHGAYQVASTQLFGERPRIVTTDLEFPSVAHVWLAQRARGAEVVHVPARDGIVVAEDYARLVDERTALVSVPLVSYAGGARLPARDVVAFARERGARTVVDAYQGAGVEPVDVRDLDCDYLVCGALKYLLGISGIAFLYVRGGLRDAEPPAQTGWFGRVDPFAFDPRAIDYPATARRFESGTPSVPSAYGAVAGLGLLAALDPYAVQRHVAGLGAVLDAELRAMGERITSPADPALRGPMVAVRDADPEALAGFLAARRIVASPRGQAVRLSLHYYNDESDVHRLVDALRAYRGTCGVGP
ncbi:aminotransferase [Pseudonocardia sp. MH-G8]|nr:aminotransferase [Pseudonocardia sp. MH-G8]